MRRTLTVAALAAALPFGAAEAQSLQPGGLYVGAEGGINWLLNNTNNSTLFFRGPNGAVTGNTGTNFNLGWTAGGVIGWDFIGPRVELEGFYRDNSGNLTVGNAYAGAALHQLGAMANVYYDFFAGQTITPYIGAGAGVATMTLYTLGGQSSSTQFAYQGIIGVGWNIDSQFRLNLDGRFFGTTAPTFGTGIYQTSFVDNNITLMASLHYKLGAPAPAVAPPPPAAPVAPSFMVFFDWDRSNLSQQALVTIQQAANAFKQKGNARITATGHTDTTGPESYNMALSLRRANAVKDALVRDGVPAPAISVVGKGETDLLVPTGDGVREPQNRRVVIVLN